MFFVALVLCIASCFNFSLPKFDFKRMYCFLSLVCVEKTPLMPCCIFMLLIHIKRILYRLQHLRAERKAEIIVNFLVHDTFYFSPLLAYK